MTQFVLHSLRQTFARPLLLLVLSLWTLQGLQAQTDKPVILVFGDSLSAGYRMEEEQGWVALLADRLAAQNSPFGVVNASVSGETTVGGLARLPAALTTHMPAVVILELGGNDGLRGLPVANIRQNLDEMEIDQDSLGEMGGEAALDAIADFASSAIPFRGWVRRLSGAESHQKRVQAAISAGEARRAYLKGLGEQLKCAPPASPNRRKPAPK
jgi:hypothetical protein